VSNDAVPAGDHAGPAPSTDGLVRTLRRAFAGLTRGAWLLLGLALLIHSVSVSVLDVLVAWREGRFGPWLTNVASYGAFLALAALPVVLGVTAVGNLGPQRGAERVASLSVAVVATTFAGMLLRRGARLLIEPEAMSWSDWLSGAPHILVEYALMAAAATIVVEFLRRQRASVALMHRAEVDRLALDREMAEARMQVMRAQIEPHFLFNTLANVRRLYQTDAAAGQVMLDNLMRYFAVALPRMRAVDSDLGCEAELIEAYLGVHRVRMGTRLGYRVDVPRDMRHVRVPPMMLLTLVENAIKHGLNPLPEGGFLRVRATVERDAVLLEVSDSGRGFGDSEGTGGGTGLANIRARLHAAYGAAAELVLKANAPRGVTATIRLPRAALEAGT
jgi:signal transduction histidine kinase